MRVRYSLRAVADLAGIADRLMELSPQGARSVERAIRATVLLIAEYPGCGRTVEQRPGVRVLPVGRYPYLVFYTVIEGSAVVLHIRHAARASPEREDL